MSGLVNIGVTVTRFLPYFPGTLVVGGLCSLFVRTALPEDTAEKVEEFFLDKGWLNLLLFNARDKEDEDEYKIPTSHVIAWVVGGIILTVALRKFHNELAQLKRGKSFSFAHIFNKTVSELTFHRVNL